MSEMNQVNCPACSQAMRFQAGSTGQVGLTCPKCSNLFQVRLGAKPETMQSPQPVIAIPVQASAKNDPFQDILASADFSRPLPLARPVVRPSTPQPAFSPVVMVVLPLVLVGVLVIGIGGYFTFSWIGAFKADDQSSLAAGETAEALPLGSSSANGQAFPDIAPPSSSWGTGLPGDDASASPIPSQQSSGLANERSLDSMPRVSATSMSTTSPATSAPANGSIDNSKGGQNATSHSLSAVLGSTPPASLADVIEQAEKSVVRIEVTSSDGDSLGSGFVVDNMGTLVTNCHVLAGASSAVAFFPDGRRVPILGTMLIEEAKDIAIAQIADAAAPPISLAAALPRKGERVTALGAPHGLAFTATTGIVSAIRPGSEIDSTHRGTWIQVDAAISPGNSGGPLINGEGEVVGMSTLASQGTAQNLNFGISGIDISEALARAGNTATVSLADGVGKLKMREPSSAAGGDSPIDESKISDEVLAAYVSSGIDEFDELLKSMRVEALQMGLDLKEMKKGPPGPLAASALGQTSRVVIRLWPNCSVTMHRKSSCRSRTVPSSTFRWTSSRPKTC